MSQLRPVRIATARIEAGYGSAEEFGEALGVSGQAVRDWEKGRSHPRPANLEKIMELTGKPLMYFYGGDAGNNDALAARLETLIAQVGGGPAGEMVAIPLYERASPGALERLTAGALDAVIEGGNVERQRQLLELLYEPIEIGADHAITIRARWPAEPVRYAIPRYYSPQRGRGIDDVADLRL